jgi:hypothetical protein
VALVHRVCRHEIGHATSESRKRSREISRASRAFPPLFPNGLCVLWYLHSLGGSLLLIHLGISPTIWFFTFLASLFNFLSSSSLLLSLFPPLVF